MLLDSFSFCFKKYILVCCSFKPLFTLSKICNAISTELVSFVSQLRIFIIADFRVIN